MEKLQGLIDSCFLEDFLDVDCFEHGLLNIRSTGHGEEEDEELQFSTDKMPFLQMLQTGDSPHPQFLPFGDPTFQSLLKFRPLGDIYPYIGDQTQALEHESCVTQETVFETQNLHQTPLSAPCIEGLSAESNKEHPVNAEESRRLEKLVPCCSSSILCTDTQINNELRDTDLVKISPGSTRERRKRKRTKAPRNKEDVENQRMTHIAVERNRRKQMNDHLNCLRSFMPPCYVQRGDQASIIGGAIAFVKELEQLLQSLEAEKRIKTSNEETGERDPLPGIPSNMRPASPSAPAMSDQSEEAKVDVTVIQNHVSLKVRCPRSQGLLLKSIVALEELRLIVLHLNVTTCLESAFYAFSLKMEDDCKLRSAEEIGAAVHGIFDNLNAG